MVILTTGKQGAGKTYYNNALAAELKAEGHQVEMLDGDAWRLLHKNGDFSDEGRKRNLVSAAAAAAKHEAEGKIVLLSFVAPKKEWRDAMRAEWKQSRVIYIPGGSLWPGTTYEVPTDEELDLQIN